MSFGALGRYGWELVDAGADGINGRVVLQSQQFDACREAGELAGLLRLIVIELWWCETRFCAYVVALL